MTTKEAFLIIHENLPRQGPGSDDTTNKLLDYATKANRIQTAIDMGCGPGRSTLIMAARGIAVTAIDTHQPFLDELASEAKSKGLTDKIKIENVSMDEI